MAADRSHELPHAPGSAAPLQWISDTASDTWSSATKLVSDHPLIATTAAVVGTAAAIAAFRGRAGAVVEAVTTGTKPALEIAGLESQVGKGLLQGESVLTRNVGGELAPVWINGTEKVSPGGIHLITTDLSGLGAGQLVDAFPQVPKLVVSDPLFRAGGLVTNFDGNLGALYESASNSVVRLQVTRAEGAATLAKTGSGYFNPEGEIVTAHHVISGGEEINVFGNAFGKPLRAVVKSTDPANDLAVLKLVDPPADILRNIRPFGYRPPGEMLKPAEQVVGFGYPDGVKTLTAMPGNFSNWKNIQLGVTPNMTGDAIRSFMEAAPGASGGAMVDSQGRIFGTIVQMQPNNHAAWSVPFSAMRGF
ncbi:MAG: trypsin-like peptidase domain-containing protein [Candidatus Melainabacteria bacterium]|nr:trypsin-like peptidase domain-containing protein [Candidatus Melainabacteria bacterium]